MTKRRGKNRRTMLYAGVVIEPALLNTPAGEPYLLVLGAKDIVEARPVKLGPAREGLAAIDAGLKPEDWVVLCVERALLQASHAYRALGINLLVEPAAFVARIDVPEKALKSVSADPADEPESAT